MVGCVNFYSLRLSVWLIPFGPVLRFFIVTGRLSDHSFYEFYLCMRFYML